jgi:hypothetical protein
MYGAGEMIQDEHRREREVGVQRCQTQQKACLAKAKTDVQIELCTGNLDMCIENLP